MSKVAFPFLTLSPERVKAQPWQVSLNGEPAQTLGEMLRGWDYNATLVLSRTIQVDLEAAARELRVDGNSLSLSVAVRIGTGEGQLPRLIVCSEAFRIDPANPQCDLRIEVPSEQLATAIHVFTDILVAAEPGNAHLLSPRKPGSRIWSDELKVWLEGKAPRFPLTSGPLAEDLAPWRLYWNPGDWGHDFNGAVSLVVNNKRSDVLERIRGKDKLVLEAALADTISQILETLLRSEDPEANVSDALPGSLADKAHRWIEWLFREGGIAAARQQLEVDPGRFRAMVWQLARLQEE